MPPVSNLNLHDLSRLNWTLDYRINRSNSSWVHTRVLTQNQIIAVSFKWGSCTRNWILFYFTVCTDEKKATYFISYLVRNSIPWKTQLFFNHDLWSGSVCKSSARVKIRNITCRNHYFIPPGIFFVGKSMVLRRAGLAGYLRVIKSFGGK